jgi:hypothetical protein
MLIKQWLKLIFDNVNLKFGNNQFKLNKRGNYFSENFKILVKRKIIFPFLVRISRFDSKKGEV